MSYWETWDNDEKSATVHWGQLGHRGQDKIVTGNFHDKIQKEIDERIEQGYLPVDEDDHTRLLIEFMVNGMGTHDDLEKRTRLQSSMDETLGWTALGHCDGGSIGSGTMEVCCIVVDFEIARQVIEKDLTTLLSNRDQLVYLLACNILMTQSSSRKKGSEVNRHDKNESVGTPVSSRRDSILFFFCRHFDVGKCRNPLD